MYQWELHHRRHRHTQQVTMMGNDLKTWICHSPPNQRNFSCSSGCFYPSCQVSIFLVSCQLYRMRTSALCNRLRELLRLLTSAFRHQLTWTCVDIKLGGINFPGKSEGKTFAPTHRAHLRTGLIILEFFCRVWMRFVTCVLGTYYCTASLKVKAKIKGFVSLVCLYLLDGIRNKDFRICCDFCAVC